MSYKKEKCFICTGSTYNDKQTCNENQKGYVDKYGFIAHTRCYTLLSNLIEKEAKECLRNAIDPHDHFKLVFAKILRKRKKSLFSLTLKPGGVILLRSKIQIVSSRMRNDPKNMKRKSRRLLAKKYGDHEK